LSSKDLKPAEIRILSKGLNFCPTPNKINEEQLSADLDKFARSLRIKALFSAEVRLLWVGMFVLVAVWTSFLTKSIKDSKVVFLLGFGIHELFFLHLGRVKIVV
jgi:hypothetical protein